MVSRHKSEFLASMSHELRTPLNAVIGFSEVLLDQMFGELNERQHEYLRDIWSSGKHLLQLLSDILDLSKVEAGKMDLESVTFSVREALEYGISMMRERATRHGLSLILDVGPDVAVVEADELRFKQVVINLLSNAVKFTPDGGTVTVEARVDGPDVVITVTDTGVGIAPADRERIFESFQQGAQHAHARGHRSRPHAVPTHRRTDGWSHVAGERGRRRKHVRVHRPHRTAERSADDGGSTPDDEPRLHRVLVIEDDRQSVDLLTVVSRERRLRRLDRARRTDRIGRDPTRASRWPSSSTSVCPAWTGGTCCGRSRRTPRRRASPSSSCRCSTSGPRACRSARRSTS